MEDNLQVTENKREVVQSFLITSARYKFSIYEKRILSKIITSLQPMLEGQHLNGKIERSLFGDIKIEMPLSYLRGDDRGNVKQYKDALRSLSQKGIEFEDENIWTYCNLIQSPKIVKRSEFVSFSICSDMVDLFLNFTKGYSKYILDVSLSLRSTASARMYELISNQPQPLKYGIEKLKELLGAETYTLTGNFIQRVLVPAKKELDTTANWSFDFKPIKTGRKYTHILLIPINYPEREPQEVQKADAIRRTHLSWFIDTDVTLKLMDLGFSKREIKNNMETIKKFTYKFANSTIEKIVEIWVRGNGKKNQKAYLIGAMKLEVED